MESTIPNTILSLMGITLNFSTGEIGWSSGASTTTPGAGVDNLLLETGDHLLLESGTTDVILLE